MSISFSSFIIITRVTSCLITVLFMMVRQNLKNIFLPIRYFISGQHFILMKNRGPPREFLSTFRI